LYTLRALGALKQNTLRDNAMMATTDGTVWNCMRDYWRLEIAAAPLHTTRQLVALRGRRRTTEAYSPPVVMDAAALERLSWTFQSAIAVAAGFQLTGIRDHESRLPTRELLARCQGPFYQLEIHATVVTGNIESVELELFVPLVGGRPVVHLIDADIEVFAADLTEALAAMTGRSAKTNGRRAPS
jgi:hypothetical protein